jgi:hypothetical protein
MQLLLAFPMEDVHFRNNGGLFVPRLHHAAVGS